MALQPSAADVRDVRRVLASWTLEKYIAVRDEQRAKGEAPRELVWLRHNATLEEALQTLSNNRILSAPILDAYSGDFVVRLAFSFVSRFFRLPSPSPPPGFLLHGRSS